MDTFVALDLQNNCLLDVIDTEWLIHEEHDLWCSMLALRTI